MKFTNAMFELALILTTKYAGQKKQVGDYLIIVRENAVDIVSKCCRNNRSIDLRTNEVKNIKGTWDAMSVSKLLGQF